MLYRMLHSLLLALILPATAIAIIAVVEIISKDAEKDETPDWAKPYLSTRNRKRRH